MSINKISYTGKDFDTIYDDILSRLNDQFGDIINSISATDPIGMFIDLPAYALSIMAWYLDRQTNEVYLDTCTDRENAAKIVRPLGYKPSRAIPATTTLSCYPTTSHAFDVTVPALFQFQSDSGLIFETVSAVTWNAGEFGVAFAKDVDIAEGETRTLNFVSDGTANQRFNLTLPEEQYIANESVAVTVDGTAWTEQDIITAEQTDQYEIEYDSNPPVLRFGDGMAGNKPLEDVEIFVTYRVCYGSQGNISAIGKITSSVIPLIIGGTTITMSITQGSIVSGGDDPESLESVKANAPKYYAARNVAVTTDDYVGLSLSFSDPQYGKPAVANAINTRGSNSDGELISLLQDLKDVTNDLKSLITIKLSTIDSSKTSLTNDVATISAQTTSIDDNASDIESTYNAIGGSTSNISGFTTMIDVKSVSVGAKAADIVVDATAIYDGTADPALQALATEINTLAAEIASLSTSIQGLNTNIEAQNEGISVSLATLPTVKTELETISTLITNTTNTSSASLLTITNSVSDISSSLDTYDDDINSACTTISDHFDEHWSPTNANIVTVPILVKDSDGYYAAPTNGLMRALKEHLDERKDVTHTVNVISGAGSLVGATVTVYVKVTRNYVVSTVLSQVTAKVNELLKDREYGIGLRLQDIYDIKEDVSGIDYMNVTLGPSSYVDVYGNLTIDDDKIITRGTVTVTAV